jgi:hypothetical protein
VVNKSLGNFLRSMSREKLGHLDLPLDQAEFSCNDYNNRSMGNCRFHIVYGRSLK